jgi:hypothetical protein
MACTVEAASLNNLRINGAADVVPQYEYIMASRYGDSYECIE